MRVKVVSDGSQVFGGQDCLVMQDFRTSQPLYLLLVAQSPGEFLY